jgi:phosphotransferase system enzyme I (PtsI)
MGIPAIIGLGSGLSPDLADKPAAMDGGTGALYIDPQPDIFERLKTKSEDSIKERRALEQFRGKPALSKNGRAIKLYANIGSVSDAEAALAGDAEGIGLFRSEFLYLDREDYPGERLQYEKYRKVLELMGGKKVIIRTLDIGADKQASYFALPQEANPALGMRAIRICLRRPELFKTQLRAIYRASVQGNAAVMFPMISSVRELRRAKDIAGEVRAELTAEGTAFKEIPIGIMIETPASALISDLLAPESDFFSIGTNDLTQYTLALDRQNEFLQEFYDDRHEAVLRLIRMTVENAHRAGIPAGICGALGADLELTPAFLEAGLDELSVEPASILKLRQRIAGLASQ